MAFDPRFESGAEQPEPPPQQQPPTQQEPSPPPPPPPPPPPEEEESEPAETEGSLIDLDLTSNTDVDGESETGGLAGGLLSGFDIDAAVAGDGDGEAGGLIDIEAEADTGVDGDNGSNGLGGLLSGLDVDVTVAGDGEGDGENASLIDIDANADASGDVDVNPLDGDLVGKDLISGTLVDGVLGDGSGGSDPSLLNVDVEGETETDGSVIDLGAEGIVGEESAVTEIVETVEDIVDQAGGDLGDGDILGSDMLDGLDLGETLAQLCAGDLLETGLTEDLSDVGAITGIVDEVADMTTSTVEGLLGENDLFNILDTDGLLGDG